MRLVVALLGSYARAKLVGAGIAWHKRRAERARAVADRHAAALLVLAARSERELATLTRLVQGGTR